MDDNGYELIDTARGPLRHRRLFFDEPLWRAHYGAVANTFLWPLLHLVREPLPEVTGYCPARAVPEPNEWEAYRAVNGEFAKAAAGERPDASVWVHDFHLALVPALLRAHGHE